MATIKTFSRAMTVCEDRRWVEQTCSWFNSDLSIWFG
jgi:hypothetical protein